ncbi:MAG: hypothetical protein ACK4PI_04635 [Tepidisphaerales bacterium]
MNTVKFNFSDRVRLTRRQANVQLIEGPPLSFDVHLQLGELAERFPTARVFVEASHRTVRMRFPWGTAAQLEPVPMAKRALTAFSDPKLALFTVKLVDAERDPGRLIALAEGISPQGDGPSPRRDLVRWQNKDLHGLVWTLECEEEDPIAVLDTACGEPAVLGRDPNFRALVYPEILRRALIHALLVKETDTDDDDHWFHRWYHDFIIGQLGSQELIITDETSVEDKLDWIDQVVRDFGEKQRWSRKFDLLNSGQKEGR